MNTAFWRATAAGLILGTSVANAQATKPTVVLVHGAFADASSWDGVIKILEQEGYNVVAAANPLRSVEGDARAISDLLASIASPVVLVGHSYGGMVISNAATGHSNVKALVFVDAFAPDSGESAQDLTNKFPGSLLGASLGQVKLSDGGVDLFIQPDKFRPPFAADVPEAEARLMATTQRPIAQAALGGPSLHAAWKTIPSWFVYGSADKAVPPQVLAFMAQRAHSKQTVVIPGASHVAMVRNPSPVAKLIMSAATAK